MIAGLEYQMQNEIRECDVLIVGGGPAGLSVASTLPDDVSTIILHQDREIGKPVRTSGGSWLSDMHALGIPEEYYLTLEQCEAYSDKEHSYLPLGNGAVILAITELYQWLASLSDHKNRELMLATKFLDCSREKDGSILSEIRSRDGVKSQIRSKYIVDGTGWHTAVLNSLGLVEKPERLGVGIEYEYPLGKNDPTRAFIFFGDSAPSGYGWGFPTPEGMFRLGIGVINPDTDLSPRDVMNKVMANDPEQRFGIDLSGEYTVNSGILPSVAYETKLVFGNVIRVGDSANFATPTMGEGIRVCIEFGRLLGENLGKTVKTGKRWHLWKYEWACRIRLQKDYFFGFLMNTRGAQNLNSEQWDLSVLRMGRVDKGIFMQTLRSEFRLRKMFLIVFFSVKGRIVNRFKSLFSRARTR